MQDTARIAISCSCGLPDALSDADMSGPQYDFFTDVMDHVTDAVFTVDAEMTITSYNRSAELMTGIDRQSALGQKCHQVFKTKICGGSCPVQEAIETGQKVVTREIVLQDAQGVSMPVLLKAAILYDDAGKVVGAVETMRCLRRLYSIIDSVADGLFTVDGQMKITNYNRAAEELTGIPHSLALGRHCSEVFKSSACLSGCPLQEAMMAGKPVQREMEIADRYGSKRMVSANASILYDCSGKPIGGIETLRDLTPLSDMREEMRQKFTFRRILSRNSGMRKLFDVVEDVAASGATVLLQGESGTGKELFAHAIHDLSPRRERPLVTVNCGALPETLLESEIFGVRKGAFTGAVADRPGRVEQCQGGTLFLDEIGDLPLSLQVKLLRLLEYKEFQPLGARHPLKADVRFITATHRNVEDMVRQGTFRQDLFFRINVVTLHIPPLRERRDDIPLLVEMALKRCNQMYNKSIRTVSPEVMEQLFSWPFEGNVRELLNILEQASILCRGSEISMEQMPLYFRKGGCSTAAVCHIPKIRHTVDRKKIDHQYLADLLHRHGGNRASVAQELGVDRTTLWRWMQRSGTGVL